MTRNTVALPLLATNISNSIHPIIPLSNFNCCLALLFFWVISSPLPSYVWLFLPHSLFIQSNTTQFSYLILFNLFFWSPSCISSLISVLLFSVWSDGYFLICFYSSFYLSIFIFYNSLICIHEHLPFSVSVVQVSYSHFGYII